MRKHIFSIASIMIALACVFGAGFQSIAHAQSCDYPLFIQQGAVDVNVLILLDSSGSMTTAIFHDDYDDTITYTGPWNPNDGDFSISSDGLYTPHDLDWTQGNDSTLAPLVASDMGNNGRYTRNYMNWVYFHATDQQRSELPQITRIEVARPAVNAVVTDNPNVRFGVWKFNASDGAMRIADVGADHSTVMSAISGINPGGYTPIGESMMDIYNDVAENTSAIEFECQRSFLIVVTDGLPTQDTDWWSRDGDPTRWSGFSGDSDSDGEWIDDVARHMFEHDAMSDNTNYPGKQNIVTYTIGFNIDAAVLDDAAAEGDGSYFSANNPTQLTASLNAVLRDIVNRISAGSAVAVVSTEGTSDDYLFRSKFMPGKWQGFVEAFSLPYTDGDLPAWEAGSILEARSASSRTIYTSLGGAQINFDDSYASSLRPALGVATDPEATDLINWVRGEDILGLRNRQGWKLGDIIDSSPVIVGDPAGFHLYGDYLTWRQAQVGRTPVIYTGGNDAMIHCFSVETGDELWAYVPEAFHGRLAELADSSYCHQYFCNGTPKVFDAYLGGTWRTMLVAGMREGGDVYVGIDVTVPESPVFMWETTLPDISGSWSQIEIARPQSVGNAVGFVTSGPDDALGQAYLKAIDLETGAEIYSQLLSDNAATGINAGSGSRGVDLDYDSWTDLIYTCDLEGNVWRLDLTASPWDLSLLFQTEVNQAIQTRPTITVDYNDDVFLYFGTGQYLEAADLIDTSQQTFYSLIDKHDGVTVDRLDMVDETTSITPVGPTDRGWYIDLVEMSGERVTQGSALVAGIVYFSSFVPDPNACKAGGTSFLYKVDFRNGSADDGDDDDSNDTIAGRVEDLGAGVGSQPVVDVANEDVIVQGSDTRIHVRDAVGLIKRLIVRSWRQQYD